MIANYGTKNDGFLRRLIAEYHALPYHVDIIVLTSEEKQLPDGVTVVVQKPVGDPWTFPFAHKQLIAERVDAYDLFIYSEDDTLITDENLAAFLAITPHLADSEVVGFLRTEHTANGHLAVSTVNGPFHWDPTSVVRRGEYICAYFSNEHAASYMLTRTQLKKAIASGGYLVPPHQDKYDLLVTAATDPYTQCGLTKLICISHIEPFLLPHLSNRYVGSLGIALEDLRVQFEALIEICQGERKATSLLRTESRLRHQAWSKPFYGAPSLDLTALIPTGTETVLSFGSGDGALEATLARSGATVTAVPLDSVIGACIEDKGIRLVYGDSEATLAALDAERFDCVLLLDLLHLFAEPSHLLTTLRRLLTTRGTIVVTVPNVLQVRTWWRSLKGDLDITAICDYTRSGITASSKTRLRRWFADAGLMITKMVPEISEDAPSWSRAVTTVCPSLFATRWLIHAEARRP